MEINASNNLQVVADILSKVLDERNTPAFEDTAQVTNDNAMQMQYGDMCQLRHVEHSGQTLAQNQSNWPTVDVHTQRRGMHVLC